MVVDHLAWQILAELQKDGRQSLKSLAEKIKLSVPATSERLKRLEESGVIRGYRALLDREVLGLSVMAIVGITTVQSDKQALISLLANKPEVLECLHVTGDDSYLIRVLAKDLKSLEGFVGSINHLGETRTSIVLSEPIELRGLSKS